MARQNSIVTFEGTMGGITFYKGQTRKGKENLARTKGGVDGATIKSSENFARTRENMSEFGRAAGFGKIIREAFAQQLRAVSDSSIVYRLVQEIKRIQNLDAVNGRGERKVLAENFSSLVGFLFNKGRKLDSVFSFNIASAFVSPNINFTIPVHTPITSVRGPQGASHYRIRVAGAAFNPDADTIKVNVEASTPEIALLEVAAQPEVVLSTALGGAEAGDLMVGMVSVEFYQAMNGNFYLLSNGAYTPMQVAIAGVFA